MRGGRRAPRAARRPLDAENVIGQAWKTTTTSSKTRAFDPVARVELGLGAEAHPTSSQTSGYSSTAPVRP